MKKKTLKKGIRIVVGADHAGYPVKKRVAQFLSSEGYRVIDMGTHSEDSTDYPDYAFRVGQAVATGRADRGILVCGTGIGMCIAANKVRGVFAAPAWSVRMARLASEHNRANVLCLSGRFVSLPSTKKIVKTWLSTPADLGERHTRRIKKILKYSSK